MSNRLTKSSNSTAPVWLPVIPVLLVVITGLLIFLQSPEFPPVISEEAHVLYQQLPSPVWVQYIQASSLLLIFLGSGLLIQRLIPKKSSKTHHMLAWVVGTAVTAILLSRQINVALGTQPLYPAWAFALWGGLWMMWGGGQIIGLISGLLCGLALSLDSFSMSAILPTFFFFLFSAKNSFNGTRLLFWVIGCCAGLIPVILGMTPFVFGITPEWHPGVLPDMGQLILNVFSWGSLPLILLAIAAGVLLKSVILFCWILPVFLLEAALACNSGDWLSDERFFLILPVAWLCAFGVFRVLKGIEQGVRNVNAKKAKSLPSLFIGLTLAVQAAWCLYLFI